MQRKAPSSSSRSSLRVGANMGFVLDVVVAVVDAAGGPGGGGAGKIWP